MALAHLTGTLNRNITGNYNTANGANALLHNEKGSYNTANGYEALFNNTTGVANTAGGFGALRNNISGIANTAVGTDALASNTTGNYNTALGYAADIVSSKEDITNATAIGYKALVNASNTLVLGNTSLTAVGSYGKWIYLSDARFKKNVQEDVHGLDFIMQLKPVSYTMDVSKLNTFLGVDERKAEMQRAGGIAPEEQAKMDELEKQGIAAKEAIRQSGFMAQEVEQAAKAIDYNFSGVIKPANEKDQYKMSYSDFVVPLVKAVQEQQKQLTEQQKQIEELKKLVEALTNPTAAGTTKTVSLKADNQTADLVAEGVSIYPNPSNTGKFTINTKFDNATIEVSDSSGRKIPLNVQKDNSNYNFDLSAYSKGVYVVNISAKGKTITARIIFE